MEIMARLGYGARGIVYCLVGGLALLAAFGSGGQTGGSRSALQSLLSPPCGREWKALGIRAAHLVSGGIYAGLAVFALNLAFGRGAGGGEDQAAQSWTAWLMAQPF